ncbi:hypothetical protein ACOSQ2_014253 [Xanthoceras sorbifolium]|uniref:PWWP domain-containing protein n=1 Tax=Xanthoceras sorbifolium TaxID=99658 RepID=A0ABQ8GZ85_9ROSI|nr:hypothetical protein JRO89_XSUnG0189500 [Xanthoceras sorbifolium]
MGSSGSGGDAGECGVGSIVWVRRRNGSWWPGKILGSEELTTTHLTSPRSGTPVKLLGRDDASVDWYNLEKSKRVKAFRCGEFDDCIERAEASQGMPARKREKYARREDAILHALELEKQLLRKQGKLGVTSDHARSKLSVSMKMELVTPSGNSDTHSGNPEHSNSNQLPKVLDTPPNDENSPLLSQKSKEGNQLGSEDDPSEALPRMRGLEDLGLSTGPSKRKLSSGASDSSEKPTVDNVLQTPPIGGPSNGRTCDANGDEQMGGTFRAKRSRCVYLPADSKETLDSKENPPSHIGMPHLQFEDGDYDPLTGCSNEENSSGFLEDEESDSSESSTESEADSSETEADMDEEMTLRSGASVSREVEFRSQALGEHGSMSSEEHDESAQSGDLSHLHPHERISVNEAVSKWQLKGKRNIRHLAKSSMDATDEKDFNGSIHGTYREGKVAAFSQRASGQSLTSWRRYDLSDAFDEADMNDRDFCNQMIGGYAYTSRSASRGRNSFRRSNIDWDDMTWEDQLALRGHWADKVERFSPRFLGHYNLGGRRRSMLVDVDLKVQASYQKEPVPIVSLMSKLDGKAIIGHPIQIEALQDGSSESLIPANDYFGNEAIDHDGNRTLPPAWRTARRTNFRVPRPNLSSSLNSDMGAASHSFLDDERKPLRKPNIGSSGQKDLVKKSQSHIPRPSTDRKFPKKLPKKVSLSSNQKTRTLSSIAIDRNLSSRSVYDSCNGQMNGLIKSDSSGPTTVACIPVKLVFSRLLEKINRPPSKVSSKVVQPSSDAEKNAL